MFRYKTDLLNGNIFKSLILFAIPLFISNIFQQLYNTVDIMVVGNYLGDESLAAIGASAVVYELLVGFALGIGSGMSIVVARNFGSKDEDALKCSVAGSLVAGVFITIGTMIIAQLVLKPLLILLKTPDNILEEAYSYIWVIAIFVGITFTYNLCAGLLRAIGDSLTPLVFLIISSVLNIVLDILFITRFHMGVRGAAIATIISQGVSAILCIIYIFKKCHILIPEKRHFAFNKELYGELLGQGLSMGFMGSIVTLGSVILQSAINELGYLTIAGHVAARKINSFSMMPIPTMVFALSTFVSQNKGADNGYRIRQGVRYANIMAIVWTGIIAVILFFFAPSFVKLLSGSSEAVVIENGANYLRFNSPFYAILGVLLNMRFALQGLGKKMLPLVSSIVELVGKTIFALLVIPAIGYLGVIICEPIIWIIMCVQLVYSFYSNPYIKEHKYIVNYEIERS